jgi:hypothetical protein
VNESALIPTNEFETVGEIPEILIDLKFTGMPLSYALLPPYTKFEESLFAGSI